MERQKRQSMLGFRLMALEFRLRDILRPPAGILRDSGIGPGMTVLDFGCGPGGFSLAAARLVGKNGTVHALDIHPLALEMVARGAARQGLKNVRAIEGNTIGALPDESVDMVLLYDVIHDIAEPVPVLVDIHRLLRPGGMVSSSDHHVSPNTLIDLLTDGGLFRFSHRTLRTFQFERVEPQAVSS